MCRASARPCPKRGARAATSDGILGEGARRFRKRVWISDHLGFLMVPTCSSFGSPSFLSFPRRWVRWQRSHEQRHAVDYAHVSEKTDVTAPLRRVPGVRWGAGPPRCFSTAKAKRAARAKTEGVAAEAEARYLAQRGDPSTREMRHEIDHAHVDGRTDLATPMRRVPGVRWTRPTPTDASSPDASSERKRGDAAAAKERVAARSARAEARHVGKEGALARRGRQARHAVDYAHVEAKVDVVRGAIGRRRMCGNFWSTATSSIRVRCLDIINIARRLHVRIFRAPRASRRTRFLTRSCALSSRRPSLEGCAHGPCTRGPLG